MTIATTALTLYTLLFNMNDTLKRKYSLPLKKQRTVLYLFYKCLCIYMIVDLFRLWLLLLSLSLFRSMWSAIRSPIAVVE